MLNKIKHHNVIKILYANCCLSFHIKIPKSKIIKENKMRSLSTYIHIDRRRIEDLLFPELITITRHKSYCRN